jgi:hypothetical protein
MRKMKQTLNAQRPTPNAQSTPDSELDVERWALGVGRLLPRLQ